MSFNSTGPHGDPSQVTNDKGGNVEIQETGESSDTHIPIRVSSIRHLSVPSSHQQYTAAASRWSIMSPIRWEPSSSGILSNDAYPKKIVDTFGVNCKVLEQAWPFLVHQYWAGDLEFKIVITGSPMLVGMLQVAWYYDIDADANKSFRENKAAFSQTHHCLISASESNEANLYIPYRSYRPLLNTRARAGQDEPLNMGRLYINVLNQLRVPASVTSSASVIVHARCVNSVFSGLVSSDI